MEEEDPFEKLLAETAVDTIVNVDEDKYNDELIDIFEEKSLNESSRVIGDVSIKTTYLPLKKSLYIEPPEFGKYTSQDIAKIRENNGNISVRGLNSMCPISEWVQAGLPIRIIELLKYRGFVKPTPIQCQTIPSMLSGRDLIGCAITGSGKTLAFVLPCVVHCMAQIPIKQNEALCLILSPTRELAIQTHIECQKFLSLLNMRSACLVGGNDIESQFKDIKNGAQIIVATPGRFIDMTSSSKSFNIGRIGMLVIDEADRMFDLGFEPQVHKIASMLRSDRQTVLFSATFAHSIERCARKLLSNSLEIVVGGRNIVSSCVEQHVEIISEAKKFNRLLFLLGQYSNMGQALVFTNTQSKAETLFDNLLSKGFYARLLHAGMEQRDRASILHDLRQEIFNVLILTSVGSRGLDIHTIILVINYDAPDHEADYIHRIGRTGRAGNTGYAYTFITEEEKSNAIEIRRAMMKSNISIPKEIDTLCGDDTKGKGGRFGFHRGTGFSFDKSENEKIRTERKSKAAQDENIEQAEEEEPDEKTADNSIKKASNGKFITEFEINSYSQIIRSTLTKKETIERIMEETGTSIIKRGIYIPNNGKQVVGEKPLYLLIEGNTFYSVQAAKSLAESTINEIDPVKTNISTKYIV